ncbi:hypothetical protein MtrunA17_Chr5g0400771 [Medicago truncatula]|uniref:Clavata3/ESR (CLE) gene family member MtCLE04 n=1 Tax=Medicago truncatula TaxID=3880 RepID=G7K153_MEDTR|nr:Clavata3/ESR (CLE) gene family member MtCLE04 [Medicago truncatula]RHN53890.1 hypothetical protein MtrunA17_Chr5g0400771 [Medicago truncatula]
MLTSEMSAFSVLLILLIFCNSGFCIAGGLLNFTSSASSRKNLSRSSNPELEDKRGVPSGANPLHNR